VVNVTAAVGAFVFGHLQDRIGSVRTLVVTLLIWIAAVGAAGLAVKLSAIVGPVTYGLVNRLTGGDHRIALLSTLAFFIVGLYLLRGVDEARGERVAREAAARDAAAD